MASKETARSEREPSETRAPSSRSQDRFDVERVACNLCGSGDADILYEFPPLCLVRCRGCGLVYTSPRLTEAAIAARLYDADYWRGYEEAAESEATRQLMRTWIGWLEERLGTTLTILEVGPGLGTFLDELRTAGHEVHGIEPSEHAVDFARSRYGLELRRGVLQDVRAGELPPLDAVVLNAVIEHLPDPLGTVEHARTLLRPGGLLFVSTGVFGSFNQRIAGKGWTIIAPEEHLYYFSKQTLTALLARAGLDVVRLETNGFLVNPLTKQRALVYLFNNRVTSALGLGRLTKALRLGDEMFLLASHSAS